MVFTLLLDKKLVLKIFKNLTLIQPMTPYLFHSIMFSYCQLQVVDEPKVNGDVSEEKTVEDVPDYPPPQPPPDTEKEEPSSGGKNPELVQSPETVVEAVGTPSATTESVNKEPEVTLPNNVETGSNDEDNMENEYQTPPSNKPIEGSAADVLYMVSIVYFVGFNFQNTPFLSNLIYL